MFLRGIVDVKNPSLKHFEHKTFKFFKIKSHFTVICDFPKSDYIRNDVILKTCMLFSHGVPVCTAAAAPD